MSKIIIIIITIVTGSIIGKSGSVIAEMHSKYEGVKIKFSQNNDFFPGTGDRVFSLVGTQDVISNCVADIATKIFEVFIFILKFINYHNTFHHSLS